MVSRQCPGFVGLRDDVCRGIGCLPTKHGEVPQLILINVLTAGDYHQLIPRRESPMIPDHSYHSMASS
jgi:hypothetical protein